MQCIIAIDRGITAQWTVFIAMTVFTAVHAAYHKSTPRVGLEKLQIERESKVLVLNFFIHF